MRLEEIAYLIPHKIVAEIIGYEDERVAVHIELKSCANRAKDSRLESLKRRIALSRDKQLATASCLGIIALTFGATNTASAPEMRQSFCCGYQLWTVIESILDYKYIAFD